MRGSIRRATSFLRNRPRRALPPAHYTSAVAMRQRNVLSGIGVSESPLDSGCRALESHELTIIQGDRREVLCPSGAQRHAASQVRDNQVAAHRSQMETQVGVFELSPGRWAEKLRGGEPVRRAKVCPLRTHHGLASTPDRASRPCPAVVSANPRPPATPFPTLQLPLECPYHEESRSAAEQSV